MTFCCIFYLLILKVNQMVMHYINRLVNILDTANLCAFHSNYRIVLRCLKSLIDVVDCKSLSVVLSNKIRDEEEDTTEIFLHGISEITAYVLFHKIMCNSVRL